MAALVETITLPVKKRGRPKKVVDGEEVVSKAAEKKVTRKSKAESTSRVSEKKSSTTKNASSGAVSKISSESPSVSKSISSTPAQGPVTTQILDGLHKTRVEAGLRPSAFSESPRPSRPATPSSQISATNLPKAPYTALTTPQITSSPQHQIATMSTKSSKPPSKSNTTAKQSPPKIPTSTSKKSQSQPQSKSPPPRSSTTSTTAAFKTLKSLNAQAVDASTSQFSAAATGSTSSSTKPPSALPRTYKSASRQWTALLVSMPLVLVTSWWIYERVILKQEKKALVGDDKSASVASGGA